MARLEYIHLANCIDAYERFVELIDKLKTTAEENSGFWHNRNTLLDGAQRINLVYDDQGLAAFYMGKFIDRGGYMIEFMEVFRQGQGTGRKIVEYIRDEYTRQLWVERPLYTALGFWDKMGVRPIED